MVFGEFIKFSISKIFTKILKKLKNFTYSH